MSKVRIALLSGGKSDEREVSIKTGNQIFNSLDKDRYDVFRFDPMTDMKTFIDACLAKEFDLVFPALHGPFGEDGRLQGMLDMLDIEYVFSGCMASSLAMNKYKTLTIANKAGLLTSPSITLSHNDENKIADYLNIHGLPVVIKPVESGSSVGISIVKELGELSQGVEKAFLGGNEILLEKFINGREFTVAVMGDKDSIEALPVIEIKPKVSEWFDYEAKYQKGGSEEICPAQIPEDVSEQLQNLAKKIFVALGCRDIARADFILDESSNEIFFLEINTIPGMTETSLAPLAARTRGHSFTEFLNILIEGALKRSK